MAISSLAINSNQCLCSFGDDMSTEQVVKCVFVSILNIRLIVNFVLTYTVVKHAAFSMDEELRLQLPLALIGLFISSATITIGMIAVLSHHKRNLDVSLTRTCRRLRWQRLYDGILCAHVVNRDCCNFNCWFLLCGAKFGSYRNLTVVNTHHETN